MCKFESEHEPSMGITSTQLQQGSHVSETNSACHWKKGIWDVIDHIATEKKAIFL